MEDSRRNTKDMEDPRIMLGHKSEQRNVPNIKLQYANSLYI